MSFQQTYEAELQHIRETAKDYALRYPNVAPFLENWSSDQDIERLIEAFAFLTARVQQRLNDGVPEIEQNITRMIWPGALKATPAHSIVELYPAGKFKSEAYRVPRGTALECQKSKQRFSFETLYDVDLYPLALKKVQPELVKDRERITLQFDCLMDQQLNMLSDITLPLYLADSYPNALMLNYLLQKELVKVHVTDGKDKLLPVQAQLLSRSSLDRLHAYQTQPEIFELIPFYFNFPELFSFIDLKLSHSGVDSSLNVKKFKVVIEFDLKGADYMPITERHIRLYATPVRNCEKVSVSSFRVDHTRQTYLLRLEGAHAQHQAINTIQSVVSTASFGQEEQVFYGTHEFHLGAQSQHAIYQEHVANDSITMRPTYALSFQHAFLGERERTISVTATGLSLNAHEKLGLGDIKPIESDAALVYGYRNIAHVTPVTIPHYHEREAWNLMNYVSLRLNQIDSTDVFRNMLMTFNHHAMRSSNQQKALTRKVCEGLFDLNINIVERLHRRHFIRGHHIELMVKESNFMNDGEIYLFGSMWNDILQSWVEVNHFIELSIRGIERGVTFQWPVQF